MKTKKINNRNKLPPKPSDQLDEVIKNALQFIERGLQGLESKKDKQHLKYSVINFYTGVELILKSRLMMEHWALIVAHSGEAEAEKFLRGDFKSVGLHEAIKRLRRISMLSISSDAENVFDKLRQHRNKMVHFFHPADLRTKDGREQKKQIIIEQYQGWFYLRRLLADDWHHEFEKYQDRIYTINSLMKKHHQFLATVYSKIKPELDVAKRKGATLGRCWSCKYDAHVIDELGPFESVCKVCTTRENFLRVYCGEDGCHTAFLLEGGYEKTDCPSCGEPSENDHAQDDYSEEGRTLSNKALYDGAYGSCGECGGYETVGTVEGGSFCFCCFAFDDYMEQCGYCGEKGTHIDENSYLTGCSQCFGKEGI